MYQSVPQRHHALLPRPDHDEQARQLFARDFRRYILLDLPQQTRQVYEHVVRPVLRVRTLGEGAGTGSLMLQPDFKVPAYLKDVDIHCMPGNYHAEYGPGYAAQGAVFDRGSFLCALGGVGELNDATGHTLITALRQPQALAG